MATNEEHEKLLETLKFTPRTYKVSVWGYGGEIAMGTLDKKTFDYFKKRRLSISEYAWSCDYAEDHNIPEEFQPFEAGSWYECDDLAHVNGASRDAGTLQIDDENGNTILERSLDSIDGTDIELCCDNEAWVGMVSPGEVVFVGRSNEKGTFIEGEIELTAPFELEKLTIHYEEVDGEDIVTGLYYEDQDINSYGGSTDGKSSDFCMCLVKEDKSWEKYVDHDSIEYPLTDWFPDDIEPVRPGLYDIETVGENPYKYHAQWTGSRWINSWTQDDESAEAVAVARWRGIPYDPDTEMEKL